MEHKLQRNISIILILCLIQSLFFSVIETTHISAAGEEGPENLALGKTRENDISRSSDCIGCGKSVQNAVDGDLNTDWAPTHGDVTDDHNVWVEIDLGESTIIDEVVLKGLNSDSYIIGYQILYRMDEEGRLYELATKDQQLASEETISFEPIQARSVRISLDIKDSATGREDILSELEIYHKNHFDFTEPILGGAFFSEIDYNELIALHVEEKRELHLIGIMDDGSHYDEMSAQKTYFSTDPTVVTVNESGELEGVGNGLATIVSTITVDGVSRTTRIQVQVEDPLYSPLESVFLSVNGENLHEQSITMIPGDTMSIGVNGLLENGKVVEVTEEAVLEVNLSDILLLDENNTLTAIKKGTAALDISVTRSGVEKSIRVWIDVYDQNTDHSKINLAYMKDVTASSECGASCGGTFATNVVDGDEATYWRALSGDYNDDQQHQLTIDLGRELSFNKTEISFNLDAVANYELFTSNDEKNWTSIYVNKLVTAKDETAIFEEVQARYLMVNIHAKASSVPLIYEFSVFHTDEDPVLPAENPLMGVELYDSNGEKYEADIDLKILKGDTKEILLNGVMFNGEDLSEQNAEVEFWSSRPEVAQVDENGMITALSGGVTVLTGKATVESITQMTSIFIVVEDPAERIVDTTIIHEKIESDIGLPAIIVPGDEFPQVKINSYRIGKVNGQVIGSDHNFHYDLQTQNLSKNGEYTISIPGKVKKGTYEIQLEFKMKDGEIAYDTLYFHVLDEQQLEDEGQSNLAFLNGEGNLEYTSDFRGNQIMDFSNSGYMGGGVQIPNVQARIVLEPKDGDDTERIQDAIDFVSQLPIQPDGFRGAILLKKGTFEIEGTLRIEEDGVVLRGEGNDENGTIILATGRTKRTILEVGDLEASPTISVETKTNITDLYVPVGSRSFNVADSSDYKIGDAIIIRRYGNSSWIHEINMDRIPDRGETVQWEPFALDYDRVITDINEDTITIDAPIPNAIEHIWGGGEIYQYDDSNRIQNVGVENFRVNVEFDPSIIDFHNGEEYYADEDKADTFLSFEYTKNAWMRNITAQHLGRSIINVGRHSKWITIQDSDVSDMVSRISGSRRYPFNYVGQLSLTQRVHVESARHAFIFDKQVVGPNVILDSTDVNSYARSEPHQRWAVGGLFDNVTGNANAMDRGHYGTGHGWAGANFVFWNHSGELAIQRPPTAQNYAIGLIGERKEGDFKSTPHNIREDGYWEAVGKHVSPKSLYLQQLEDRMGSDALMNIEISSVGGGEWDVAKLPDSTDPSLDVFIDQLEAYIDSNEISGPLVNQLRNSLRQAEHHFNKGSEKKAIDFLEKFLKHLNNKSMQKHISKEVKLNLTKQAEELINDWIN